MLEQNFDVEVSRACILQALDNAKYSLDVAIRKMLDFDNTYLDNLRSVYRLIDFYHYEIENHKIIPF